jgi:ribosomal small subunit protein bTHX
MKGMFVILAEYLLKNMGRGDKKSKKGKRTMGSFGVTRSKNAIKARLKRSTSKKVETSAAADAAPKVKRAAKKKTEA